MTLIKDLVLAGGLTRAAVAHICPKVLHSDVRLMKEHLSFKFLQV